MSSLITCPLAADREVVKGEPGSHILTAIWAYGGSLVSQLAGVEVFFFLLGTGD